NRDERRSGWDGRGIWGRGSGRDRRGRRGQRGRNQGARDDEGADAVVGEDLGQEPAGEVVRQDVDAGDATGEGRLDGPRLGEHAVGEAPGGAEAGEAGQVGIGDERAGVARDLQDAGGAGEEDQLLGLEGDGYGGGGGVGVDVEERAGGVGGERRDDRHH